MSDDAVLVAALERLDVRRVMSDLAYPALLEREVSGLRVVLFDTRGASAVRLDQLRELCRLPVFRRRVSVVLAEDEPSVADHERVVGCDDAELRDLPALVLARRLRGWRLLAEERHDHSLLTRALDASVNGVCIADARRRGFPITYVSNTFERLTGYTAAECVGHSCRFLQHADTSPDGVAVVREALAAGTRATVILSNMRKDGSTFWNELTVLPIRDERGEVESIVGVQHDVSSLITAQTLHRNTEERATFMGSLLDEVEALLTTDAEARITYANRAAEDLLERPLDEILGRDAIELLGLPEAAATAIRRRAPRAVETTYELTSRGTIRPIELVLRASSGEGAAWVVTLRDAAKHASLANERDQARRLVALGTMLSGLAHEIRNPLATMSLLLGELSDSTDVVTSSTATKMRRQLDRVTRLVRETSAFARPHPPHRTVVEARQLAVQAVDTLRSRIAERAVQVEVQRVQGVTFVYVDEKQTVQLLVAVIGNAIEAARHTVSVAVSERDQHIVIAVVDDGPGIDAVDRASVFEPFFTTKASGNGLGLAIARRLAEAQGGVLTVAETSPDGTTFALTLERESGPR